jgi:cysteinyl-tRNA synthetase
MFQLSDELRDDILPYLGIRLEDKAKGQPSIWKLEDPEVLLKEKQKKIDDKLKAVAEKEARRLLELKKKSTTAQEWFKVFFSDKYSQFDSEGLPSHDIKGKELIDSIKNKLKKEWNKQDGVYKKWAEAEEKA